MTPRLIDLYLTLTTRYYTRGCRDERQRQEFGNVVTNCAVHGGTRMAHRESVDRTLSRARNARMVTPKGAVLPATSPESEIDRATRA
jgi:hypothetical protein